MPNVVSVAEMVAIEKAANASGLSYTQMMENAGSSLAKSIIAHSQGRERSLLALIGKGNNGGDALVACAILVDRGWKVTVLLQAQREGDSYLERLNGSGALIIPYSIVPDKTQLEELLNAHAFLMDGLLGTGIKLPLRKEMADFLVHVKTTLIDLKTQPYVIAVDCPSGMDCDSGEVAEQSLKADLTISMAAIKRGMLTFPSFEYLGELEVGDIGLPADLPEWAAIKRLTINEQWTQARLPIRPASAHKGTFGTALIVAGSKEFPGAAQLAGQAAARSGAGLISMATPTSVKAQIVSQFPEAIWPPLSASQDWISMDDIGPIAEAMHSVDSILLGPGVGQHPASQRFLKDFLTSQINKPLVIDADGLRILSNWDSWHLLLPRESILTPHPGEMAALTGLSVEYIQSNRLQVAERFAAEWNQIVLLKGAISIIAAPDRRTALLPISTSALATAGTGDVLAGLITGLLAQGLNPFEAACTGAWLHAKAGQITALRIGSNASVVASDLLVEFPKLLNKKEG